MGKIKTLSQVILKYKSLNFSYGVCDCCLFTKDIIEAIHGVKIKHPIYRGRFKDFKNIFKEYGVTNTKDFIEKILIKNDFLELKKNTILQHGDIVIVINNNRYLSSVCINDKLTSVSDSGICILPFANIYKSFRYKKVSDE